MAEVDLSDSVLATLSPNGSAREAERRLHELGVSGAGLMDHLARWGERSEVQERWRDWESVRSRSEILLRLEMLCRVGSVDPALDAFLFFFFRSSDPSLYQAAALALGRHIPAHTTLAEEFDRYVHGRGGDHSDLLRVLGSRFARRILLTRCRLPGARVGGGLLPSPERLGPDLSGADLAVLLLAADWIVRDGRREAVSRVVPQLIDRVVGGPLAQADRTLAARFSSLLVTLLKNGAAEPAWIYDRWSEGAGMVVAAGGRGVGVGDLTRRLRCLDELARGRAGLEAAAPGNGEGSAASEGSGWLWSEFLPDRIVAWRAYLGDSAVTKLETRRRCRREVSDTLGLIGDPDAWMVPPAEDRSLSLFTLLDPLLPRRLGAGELDELVGEAGPAESDAAEERLTEQALVRFLACEGRRGLGLLDSGLLHRLGADALVTVLRISPSAGLIPVLADALEHRFRLELAMRPEFDPEAFLLRLAAGSPPPTLFGAAREVAEGRVYADPDGTHFPLDAWLAFLEGGEVSPPSGGETERLRVELRDACTGLDLEGDLADRLHRFAGLLAEGSESGNGETGGRGLVPRFVGRIDPGAELPLSPVAGILGRMAADVNPRGREQVRRLRSLLIDLRPEAETLRRRLREALPPMEVELLDRAFGQTLGLLEMAVDAFSLVEGREGRGHRPGTDVERVISHLSRIPDPGVRIAAVSLLWREIGGDLGISEGVARLSSSREWGRALDTLHWAVRKGASLDVETREVWGRAVAESWLTLARGALEAGHPHRLRRILNEPALLPLATREEHLRFLDDARRWFLDVYRPRDAARVLHLHQVAAGGEGAFARLRTLPLFVGHYGPVWIALLVGAILMLDFGDAWTAMAEVGDVRGVGYTVALGLAGAFAYVTFDLQRRIRPAPEDSRWMAFGGTVARASAFILVCASYTALITSGLWLLLSETEQVVRGPGAPLHVAVWTGFALFIGVFFGLVAKHAD